MRAQARVVLAVFAASLMLTACGARLTAGQRQSAIAGFGQGGQAAASGDAGPAAGPSSGPSAGTGGPITSAGGAKAGGSTVGGTTGSTGAKGPAATAVAGCPQGKGGATDVGVTANSITLANIADISGPVPGLFESARAAATAFVAYWNSTYGGVCGRQLKLKALDSQTDSNGYRAAMLDACKSSFASVGSLSAFDDGGASVEDQCGIPDISAAAVTKPHQASKVTYAADSTRVGMVSGAVPGFIADKFPQAVGKAAFLYINAGASAVNAVADVKAYEKYGHGWNFIYVQPVDISTFNYSPYVQQMKSKGVRFVQWLGAYQQAARLAQAMQQQGFHPDMYLVDPTGYNTDFVKQGGAAVDGTYAYLDGTLFEEAAHNPEMQLYTTWLKRVAGADEVPSYFGMFAWSAMRLFVTTAAKIGPDLTRAKFLTELRKVQSWDGNGLTSPQYIAAKTTSKCFLFTQLHGSTWRRADPAGSGFDCRPVVDASGG